MAARPVRPVHFLSLATAPPSINGRDFTRLAEINPLPSVMQMGLPLAESTCQMRRSVMTRCHYVMSVAGTVMWRNDGAPSIAHQTAIFISRVFVVRLDDGQHPPPILRPEGRALVSRQVS